MPPCFVHLELILHTVFRDLQMEIDGFKRPITPRKMPACLNDAATSFSLNAGLAPHQHTKQMDAISIEVMKLLNYAVIPITLNIGTPIMAL